MRTFKLLLVAVLMTTSTMALANNSTTIPKKSDRSVSYEIERMLDKSDLVIEDDFRVRVFFELSENNEIVIRSIISQNEEVAQFLMERLENKKVPGKNWDQDKLYVLPVKVQAKR